MIETPRLIIRSWEPEDASDFYRLTQDSGFTLYPITDYRQANEESARQWILAARELNQKSGLGKWGAWEKVSGELIGMGGLTPWVWEGENLVDITYRLRESAWGKGLGGELARALLDFGLNHMKLPQITATITPDNQGSHKIIRSLGFELSERITLLGIATDLYRLRVG